MFTDRVSISMLHIASKKLSLVKIWCCVKEENPKLADETIKTLFPFPRTQLCEATVSSGTSIKRTHCNMGFRKRNKNPALLL